MFIKLNSNRKVFITSDTHYDHKNLCRGVTEWRLLDGSIPIEETRDFETLEQMNNTIVTNINKIVGKDDILIHLGDWSFGGFEKISEFRSNINCKEIHLLIGNHDHHIEDNKENVRSLFTTVNDFVTFEYKKKKIECFHYPIASWNKLRTGRIHLHGHCHLNNDIKFSCGKRMDVGFDGHPEFRPYDLELEVLNVMENFEIKSGLGDFDHHVNVIKNIVG
jgi:calcineurin-like phosphoesterase family protein